MPKENDLFAQLFAAAARSGCHDEPAPGLWLCGHCPYTNGGGGPCTKCGAPRYDGTECSVARPSTRAYVLPLWHVKFTVSAGMFDLGGDTHA